MSIDRRTFSVPRLLAAIVAAIATLLLPAPRSNAQSPASAQSSASPATPQPWKIVFDRHMITRRRVFDDGTTPTNIFSVNMDKPSAELELTNDNLSTRPVWSPDGKKIAFLRGGYSGGVFVMDSEGTNVRRIADGLIWIETLAWSPDGKNLAFDVDTARHFGLQPDGLEPAIYITDVTAGTPPKRLVVRGDSPSWSPDGLQIAYTSVRSSGSGVKIASVCTISASGNSLPRTLIDNARDPSWSPDGQQILYLSTTNRKPELFVARFDGSNPKRISDPRHDVIAAAWSPDSKHIAFTSTRTVDGGYARTARFESPDSMPFQGDFSNSIDPDINRRGGNSTALSSRKLPELFIGSVDGSHTVQIGTKQALWCNQFSWSPDSVSIAGLCGYGYYNKIGGAQFWPAESIFILDVTKPNFNPRIIAGRGVESINSAPAAALP